MNFLHALNLYDIQRGSRTYVGPEIYSLSPPPLFCRVLRNLLTFVGRERVGARPPALQASLATKGNGVGVFVRIVGGWYRPIFDLACQDVTEQLAELDGVARTGEAFVCHAQIMAR